MSLNWKCLTLNRNRKIQLEQCLKCFLLEIYNKFILLIILHFAVLSPAYFLPPTLEHQYCNLLEMKTCFLFGPFDIPRDRLYNKSQNNISLQLFFFLTIMLINFPDPASASGPWVDGRCVLVMNRIFLVSGQKPILTRLLSWDGGEHLIYLKT